MESDHSAAAVQTAPSRGRTMEERLLRAGNKLRKTRIRLGLKLRGVAGASREIAEKEGYDGYGFCHPTLVRIESGRETPSIHTLYSLSAIYGTSFTDLQALYLNLENLPKHQAANGRNITGLFDPASDGGGLVSRFPHDGVNAALMSLYRAVESWDALSTQLLPESVVPNLRCGYIGLLDRTLYPILRPGSVVPTLARRSIERVECEHEFQRPIYFIESRVGRFCSCPAELKLKKSQNEPETNLNP